VTRAALVLALAGIALATALVAREGAGAVFAALAAAGAGVVWASALHLVPMVLNARAWQLLLGGGGRGRSLAFFTWLVWVREAVNGLLPVARVGGEVASARLMSRRGIASAPAVASIVADMTVSLATQATFTVAGVALLAGRDRSGSFARAGWASLAAAAIVIALLVGAQRAWGFETLGKAVGRVLGRRFDGLARGGRRTDRALRAVYRSRARVLACAGWQLAGWLAGAAEIWAFLAFAGAPVPITDAIALEALVQAASSAAFVMPAALGVQEAAFAAVGAALGLPPGTALAAALFRRARDVLVFLPALLAWQGDEGRRLLAAPSPSGDRVSG
jgi:putative membrane protein